MVVLGLWVIVKDGEINSHAEIPGNPCYTPSLGHHCVSEVLSVCRDEMGGLLRTQDSGEHGPCGLALEGVPETQKMLGFKET